jgi:hypothetical protein
MTCFAINNVMIKALGGVLPMFQTVELRGGIALPLLRSVVVRSGWNIYVLLAEVQKGVNRLLTYLKKRSSKRN